MNKLKRIQLEQRQHADRSNTDTVQAEQPVKASTKPANRLQRIKLAQLKDAEETGNNPYQSPKAKVITDVGDLLHFQAAMELDLGKIANQKDIIDKVRLKHSLLPTYLPFVDDYIETGVNFPNDVAVHVMIWLLDTLDIEKGLLLALILVEQNQKMPSRFDRDMPTFLCDFFYDWASELLKDEQGSSPYLDMLVETAEHDKWQVHPLCMSKLYVMLAKHKERTHDYQKALALCEKAEAINPEKAGVKGMKERLQKQLKE